MKENGKEASLKQAYLEINGGKKIEFALVSELKEGESYPVNMVELPGAVFDLDSLDEKTSFAVCDRIATLCREGNAVLSGSGGRSSILEHIEDAHQIVRDFIGILRRGESLSPGSAIALLQAADERLAEAITQIG